MSKSFITAAILTIAGAGAGYADSLVIREVEVNHVKGRKVNPGQTINIFGGPFLSKDDADKDKELSATIDGEKANVTFASVDAISIPISDVQRPGKITIRIIHGGANATLEMTVLDPAKEKVAPGNEGGNNPAGPGADDLIMATFSVTKLTLVHEAGKTRIDAEGTASRLQDGMNVTLSLERQGFDSLAPMRADVRGGAWKTTFGPWPKELPCGAWTVKLLFELPKQPRMLASRFRDKLPKEQKEVFDHILRQDVLIVGTPEDEKAQQETIKVHARVVVTACKELFARIDSAYISGSRCFFRAPGGAGFQQPKWEAWLQDQKLCETPEAVNAAKNDTRFASQNGHFQVDKWEKYVKEQVLVSRQTAKDQHAGFSDGWVTPLNPTVDQLEGELLAIVTERLRNTGQTMCDQEKVQLPDCVKEIPAESVGQDQVSKTGFVAKWKLLLRTIGDTVPD